MEHVNAAGGIVVPDAFKAMVYNYPSPDHARSRDREQRHRIANLLAAARRRMAALGYSKVTLRMIAQDCDTTVQTVFNLVGTKDQVLGEAISEHAGALNRIAQSWDAYPASILGFADAIWLSTAHNTDFMREATLGNAFLNPRFHKDARAAGKKFVRAALDDLGTEFRSNIQSDELAETIAVNVAASVIDWAQGLVSLPALRSNLIRRTSLLLMGAVMPERGARIEAWLKTIRL